MEFLVFVSCFDRESYGYVFGRIGELQIGHISKVGNIKVCSNLLTNFINFLVPNRLNIIDHCMIF